MTGVGCLSSVSEAMENKVICLQEMEMGETRYIYGFLHDG